MPVKGEISHRRVDMTNQKIGKLTVIGPSEKRGPKGELHWDCLCECGKTTTIVAKSLRNKKHRTESCGCLSKKHFIDYTGHVFNNITVIKHIGKDKSKNNIYNFKCFCGNIFTSQISDIKTGKIKSCGCKINSKQIEEYKKDMYKADAYNIYSSYRLSAKKANREFELEFEQFRTMLESPCYYCGVTSSNAHSKGKPRRSGGNERYLYNGVDRIDNNKGYSLENCVTACKACNISKHTLTQEYFIERAYKIVELDQKRKQDVKT